MKPSRIATLAVAFVLCFCAGFVFFYTKNQQTASAPVQIGLDKPVPPAALTDESGTPLADSQLRQGKTILVFLSLDCDACTRETEFLQKAVSLRPEVKFYGVLPFNDPGSGSVVKNSLPFKLFYDRGMKLAGQLGINRVPVKVYVEDGIIKKAWGGAMTSPTEQENFIRWLERI